MLGIYFRDTISQSHSHVQELKRNNSDGPLDNQTWQTNDWLQQKLPKFGFRTHTTACWPVEQSSILSTEFDCPVVHQNFSLLSTVRDCETGFLHYRELFKICDKLLPKFGLLFENLRLHVTP